MLLQELPTGVYDLAITARIEDRETLDNSPLATMYEDNHYKHESYGINLFTMHIPEANIDIIMQILLDLKIETDIVLSPFFHGDDVICDAYTRLSDGVMLPYINTKLNADIAKSMSILLAQINRTGSYGNEAIILENINKFHSIGFIDDPLKQPA